MEHTKTKEEKQIRVAHLTTVHHPTDPRIYHKQCLSLHKAGFDVYLIAQADGQETDKPIKHIPLKKYSSRLKRMIIGTFNVYRQAKKLQAHIYVFHDPELMFIGWLLKRRTNVVIYDIHEDYVTSILQKRYLNRFFRKIAAKFYTLIEKVFTRKLELTLAEKYYYDIYNRGTCILNYPLLNEHLMKERPQELPLENKLLYTGNVTEDRGALVHAKLPKIVENISVHFIGKCPRTLADQMTEVAGEAADRLTIEGIDQFIEKEYIDDMYMRHQWLAGIALFPPTEHYMKKELTKFFEYMNAGLPIICSNFPIWQSFIETYKCGIAVDPYDNAAIKEAILYLQNNPDKARQMGENGRRAVQEELNWFVEEEKLLNLYNDLLQKRHLVQ